MKISISYSPSCRSKSIRTLFIFRTQFSFSDPHSFRTLHWIVYFCACRFVKLWLKYWCHMDNLSLLMSLLPFWVWKYLLHCFLWRVTELLDFIKNIFKSNHFYCHITTAQVPWWVKFLWACSRQCKKQQFTYGQYIFTDCAKYTYIYSVHIVYYKDILNFQTHYTPYGHIYIMYTIYTLCSLYIVIMWRCNRL